MAFDLGYDLKLTAKQIPTSEHGSWKSKLSKKNFKPMNPCLPKISKSFHNLATDSYSACISFRVPCECCALAQQSCFFFKATYSWTPPCAWGHPYSPENLPDQLMCQLFPSRRAGNPSWVLRAPCDHIFIIIIFPSSKHSYLCLFPLTERDLLEKKNIL